MENRRQKPKSYNFFKGQENPEDKKNIFIKIWKWLRIFIYVFIFGTTLTGCIQSFVIKTSTQVGSGLEFYNSEEKISPNSVVFEKSVNSQGVETITQRKTNENFYVSNQTEEREKVIKQLKKQTENNYGKWGNYNTLVVFQNEDGTYEFPISKNDEYLFINSDTQKYNQNQEWSEIKLLNTTGLDLKHVDSQVEDPKKGTYFLSVSNDVSPNLSSIERYNTFSRDVIEYLNKKLINLDSYKDNKLQNAIKDIEEKGKLASQDSINLVKRYTISLLDIMSKTNFTKIVKNEVQFNTANYTTESTDLTGLIPFRHAESQKIIITWGDAWALGPFYGLFIWPMSKLMASISDSMNLETLAGWPSIITIIIAVLITKIISFSLRFKSLFTQSKQQEMQAKKAKIDAKYAPHKGNKQMEARQKQEISELYKKYNVSPAGPFKQLLITMPIFLAMWRILQGLPGIKATTWLGINLASTSWQELFAGAWVYLPILIVVVVVQLLQQLLPKILSRKQNNRLMNAAEKQALKKQNKMQNYTMIIFVVMGVIFQASVQIYWIFGGIWEIGQILFVHYFQRTKVFKEKVRPWIERKSKWA
ncbi:membrane protein insertase YidC [Mycoplasma procyoni]|uniref:membrane protein insertase YidC n=1 Tax=Mycoplasma procyoni TaxID=568784 RepID=UPI00197B16C5|nr:membrane protein insertase YidC [Mycoplasma procyoni]MBN3534809.1 membrane protein insertase YidC [Mycoplasma procyoni]